MLFGSDDSLGRPEKANCPGVNGTSDANTCHIMTSSLVPLSCATAVQKIRNAPCERTHGTQFSRNPEVSRLPSSRNPEGPGRHSSACRALRPGRAERGLHKLGLDLFGSRGMGEFKLEGPLVDIIYICPHTILAGVPSEHALPHDTETRLRRGQSLKASKARSCLEAMVFIALKFQEVAKVSNLGPKHHPARRSKAGDERRRVDSLQAYLQLWQ